MVRIAQMGGLVMNVLAVSGPCAGGIRRHICQLHRGLGQYGISLELEEVSGKGFQPLYLYNRLRRAKVALVHCHGFQGAWAGRLAAWFARLPAVVTLHNTLQVRGTAAWCALRGEN